MGLILDKTIKLEWHKVANTRTRCLRITQVQISALAIHLTTYCHARKRLALSGMPVRIHEKDARHRNGGFVTWNVAMQTEEKKVRKKLQSGRYMTLETRKDGTKFTNRKLKEAAERLQAISRSYDQRQHALVEQVRTCCTATHPLHAMPACLKRSLHWQIHQL